ncbi:MAG: bifunctional diaminohydroxyphosphoribosylaminopyrimidine deaminase/5-amino-6-(5-phosphoribosylamino)uracil reductase RibD [Gemmataceae bacterium]
MRRALALAGRGRGYVEPNPLVGAVLVQQGQLLAEGWHARFGGPHAEIEALRAAGERARGATLYVTLEPCCHHGKTPPCTEAILRAGVQRVVCAMADPFEAVQGKGIAQLRAAGVEVTVGVCEQEARELNRAYLTLITCGRPYVIAKWAMSLDGKIATRTGQSRWLTGDTARQRAHALRGSVDGIVVGIGTVLADDPLLTARPPGPRCATRVVLDSRLRLPVESRLVRTRDQAPVLVVCLDQAVPQGAALLQRGCELLPVPPGPDGRPALTELLRELGRRRWTYLLVEGGARVLGNFFDTGLVDEVWVFVAPILLGGAEAPSPIEGTGIARLEEALRVTRVEVERLDDDWLWRGRVTRLPSAGTRAPELPHPDPHLR